MRVKVHLDSASAILAKRKLGKGGQAQRYMVSEVRRKTDPYVPFLNGPLKNTAVEHENSIEYVTPYARRQYYEHKGDGLRGREWDKRMWADRGQEITQSVADYIGGKAK
jgi:hypothetical protein